MKNIFEILRQKEQELSKARTVCQRLEYEVAAIKLTAKLVSGDEVPPAQEAKQPSQVQMIRSVLQEKGAPLHMGEIVEGVKKKYGKRLNPQMMAAVIYRYAKRGKTFYKDSSRANTWGLLDWQIASTATPLEQQKPLQ